jgi:diguanylate cyclase (GGDEF)-like protein
MQAHGAAILANKLDKLMQEWLNSSPPTQAAEGALRLTTETTYARRQLLEGIIESLQQPSLGLPIKLLDYAQGLGRHYQAQGGDLQGIISEFASLRSALWQFLRGELGSSDEAVMSIGIHFVDALDSFMLRAVKAYVEAYTESTTQAAALDSLTRTLTRGYLMEQLRLELERARRYRHPLTILLLDLDQFKKVNDTFGHLAGDEALRRFAAVLMEASRGDDFVGRFGGDEFLMPLPETSISGAIAVANRLLHRLAEAQIPVSESGEVLTASVGLAAYPEAGTTLDSLVGAADAALYEAKGKGGNAVTIRRQDGSFDVVKPTQTPPHLGPIPPMEPPIALMQVPPESHGEVLTRESQTPDVVAPAPSATARVEEEPVVAQMPSQRWACPAPRALDERAGPEPWSV